MIKNKDISKEDFKEDIKSDEGFLNPLKKVIKKKDKKEYNETLKMMQYEYDSAMLWYKFYCKNIIEAKPVKKKEEKIKKEKKKKEKKVKKPETYKRI